MQVIQIEIKSVYGAIKYYPVNQAAQLIAQIAGTKTLSAQALKLAVQLGMQIEYVNAYASAQIA